MSQPTSMEPVEKVLVIFNAVGDAPILKGNRAKIKKSSSISEIYVYLRRRLKIRKTESLYIYINQCFCPSQDDLVGELFEYCQSNNQLQLSYCKQPVWG